MNYDERIAQCDTDIAALLAERTALRVAKRKAEEIQWKHGDTANGRGVSDVSRLFIGRPKHLRIFDKNGLELSLGGQTAEEWAKEFGYVKTGNIFER